MSDNVQFDEWRPSKDQITPPSAMVRFVMNFLGAKNEHAANTVLLVAALIFFVLTVFVIFMMIL